MTSPTLTAGYSALLAIFYVAMSAHVIAARARTNISIGDGGNPHMLLAIRRHGNLAEYLPFAIVLMALAEMLGTGAVWLHASGLMLIGGRILHPIGLSLAEGTPITRVAGTLTTFGAILLPAGAIIFTWFN